MAKRKPQIGDIWKSYYTDDRYEPDFYLVLTDRFYPYGDDKTISYYKSIHLNTGIEKTFGWFSGKRQADEDCWEVMERVG